MKTIQEEKAQAFDNFAIGCALANAPIDEYKVPFECGFGAGVEFAQRWIPISEELPEHRLVVLAKVPLINYPLLFCYNEVRSKWFQLDDGEFYESEITPIKWRPIELK